MNNNFYTISPSGGMGSGYCDVQPNDSPICMELDIAENNGNTNGQTTWHTWYNHDGGCDQDGCYGSYSGCKFHIRTEFAEDGGLKQFINNNEVPINQHGSLGSAEKGEIVKQMNSNGAAIMSTQWSGWVPWALPHQSPSAAQERKRLFPGKGASWGHKSHNQTYAAGDSNDASYSVQNVIVHAPQGIKFGSPPATCQGPTPPGPPSPGPPSPPAPSPSGTCQTYVGKNNDGTNLKSSADITSSAGDCCDRCASADGCVGYTWVHENKECWLKSSVDAPRDDDCGGCVTSGTFKRPSPVPTPPTPVPPSPSPGPVPGCPGGSLAACISVCPDDDPAMFQTCVHECTDRCGGGSSCTGGDDGSDAASCMANCPSETFSDCITCCTKKFPSFI